MDSTTAAKATFESTSTSIFVTTAAAAMAAFKAALLAALTAELFTTLEGPGEDFLGPLTKLAELNSEVRIGKKI